KELGIDTSDLITLLEKLGIRGRKPQSSLDYDEERRVRAVFSTQKKLEVYVGEEKIVADRVVPSEDQNLGEIQVRETIVERRVRANVVRRRAARTAVAKIEENKE